MKRPSSARRSYLQQLAAPLPQTAALLYARRPVARQAGSVLDSIPPIVDSVDSVETFADHNAALNPPAEASIPRNASVRTLGVQREVTSVPVVPASVERTNVTASRADVGLQLVDPRSSLRQGSAPTVEVAQDRSTRLDPEPTPQLAASMRPSFAEPPPVRPVSSSAPFEAKRERGVQVHIGTVEVRIAAPAPRVPQPSPNQRGDSISNHTGRPAHAEPLSRGLAWSHGLVQG